MKRRLKSITEYSLTTAAGNIDRNRSSEKPSDMRRAKRVRFEGAEMDGAPVRASSEGRETTRSAGCGGPKTSEYAYFRKVKNGAVRAHSRALHNENEQLKSSKFDYLNRGNCKASDKLQPCMKDPKFSVSGERAGPFGQSPFPSPRVSKYDEPDQIRRKESTHKIKRRSSFLSENVTLVGQSLFSSPLNVAVENSENQCSEKGIFSAKRHRLRQWVAHASFSEVEKLHPKGFDMVSLLLCRLFPKSNENNDSSKRDADSSSKSLKLYEPNNLEKGLCLSHKRDWDKDLPKICSARLSEVALAEWDSFVSGFPSNYRKERYRPDEYMDPDRTSRSSQTWHGFSFCLPFESYRSSGSFDIKDLDEFGSVTDRGKEPCRLLLEWDSELGKDRIDSSIVNYDIEKNVRARLASSWNVDQQRVVDNVLDTKGLCPSSLFSNCYLEFNALPNGRSTGCLMHDSGRNFEDVKSVKAEPGQFSLSVPRTPLCITLAEDKNGENTLSNSDIIFSYRDQHWHDKKVWDDNPQSEFWWKCIPASDFPAEDHPSVYHAWQFPENDNGLYSLFRPKEAPGEPLTPSYEGAFNRYFLSPFLQSSLDTYINHPLLLNHVSQDSPGQELYFDDCHNELGY